ncbi:MAG: RNA methyltransferase [Alphaproteobacteria bacterium]
MATRTPSLGIAPKLRGYFGVGCYGISKAGNAGAIFRTAHAFGGSFVFTVDAAYNSSDTAATDTSQSTAHVPFYQFPSIEQMVLPQACQLVGVELTDDAVELPSFRHPSHCAYILGPERGSLPAEVLEKCTHVVKIPTKFCVNVSVAASLVLYDRVISMGRFAPRPERAGGPTESLPEHIRGDVKFRNKSDKFLATPPKEVNN